MTSSPPNIAFDDLLTALQSEGFSLSPGDYIEFTAVFNQFTGSREDLKYRLAPILCRNREDQQKFYEIYDQYATPADKYRPYPQPKPHPFLTQRSIDWSMGRAVRLYYAVLVLAFLSVTIQRALRPHIKMPAAITVPITDTAFLEIPATTPAPPARKMVVSPLKPVHEPRPEEKSILVPSGPEVEKENRVHSTAFAWLLIFGVTSLILSVSFFPLKRSRSRPHVDIDKLKGDSGPLDIPFLPKEYLITDLPLLVRIARDLAQPLPTDHHRLEINATIHESIRLGGLLTPVFSNIHRRPEWLVLIDNRAPVKTNLYRHLCRTLIRYGLPIDYYYHDGDGNYYTEGSAIALNAYQLRQRHGDAHTITFDDLGIPDPLMTALPFGYTVPYASIPEIRKFLGDEDLFQWLCAIAVFPTVRWETVLATGAAVLKTRNVPHKLNLISLICLSRLEWLFSSSGSIPDHIRLPLLKTLGVSEELAAREAILSLLRESDDILTEESITFEEKMQQVYTQSFILFAHDTRRNRSFENDARKFISSWNRRRATDLATFLYLSNPDSGWDTPIRSAEDPRRAANADRFIDELLARKLVANPRMRALFRNLAATFFFILLFLFLLKDNIQPTAFNDSLGLIERDYPTGFVTVNIPVTECLKEMTKGHYLRVTLRNYDNNLYTQLFDLQGKDTLRAGFSDITMAGKDTSLPAIRIILNHALSIECPDKQYHSSYTLILRGEDCAEHLPIVDPVPVHPANPNAMTQ